MSAPDEESLRAKPSGRSLECCKVGSTCTITNNVLQNVISDAIFRFTRYESSSNQALTSKFPYNNQLIIPSRSVQTLDKSYKH